MKKGQMIIAAVFVMVLVTLFGLSASLILSSESISITKNYYGIQALNVAEGGVRFTITSSLETDNDWTNQADFGPVTLTPGTFTVHYIAKEKKSCTFEVTSVVKEISRTVRVTLKKSDIGLPFNFDFAQYSGGSGGGATLIINGNAVIDGDYYYYGPISMRNSAHQINGTLYSTSITLSGTASYASWEAAPPVDMPAWDNTYYNNILTATNSNTASTLTLGFGQTLALNGATRYYRSVTINWGATITGPGTIVATAKPSGTGDITMNYGQGVGPGVRFVANRDFIYQGGSNFSNSVEVYVKRRINTLGGVTVPAGSRLYSFRTGNSAITLNGNTTATILAPYGQITTGNGYTVSGLLYCNQISPGSSGTIRGAIVSNLSSTIGGSVTLIYDPAYLPTIVPGLPGSGTGSGESGVGSLEASDWTEIY